MHITVSDEVTNKKATACVDREYRSAIVLYYDDWATLDAVVQILAGMKVPRVYLSVVGTVPMPPNFEHVEPTDRKLMVRFLTERKET